MDSKYTTLVIINLLSALVSVIVNVIAILVIMKTKQYRRISAKIILFQSLVDFCDAIFGRPCFCMMFAYPEMNRHGFIVICFIQAYLFTQSAYSTSLLALDRYIHVKYLTEYDNVATKSRFRKSLCIVFFLAVMQALLETISVVFLGDISLEVPIHVFIFVFTIVLYLKSIKLLKAHQQYNNIDASTKSIVKTASTVMFLLLAFYAPSVIIAVLEVLNRNYLHAIIRETMLFVIFATHTVMYLNGTANAIAFLSINRESRAYLRPICCSKKITPLENI